MSWMSIRVSLCEWIFRHGCYHGHCMDTFRAGVSATLVDLREILFLRTNARTHKRQKSRTSYLKSPTIFWRCVAAPLEPSTFGLTKSYTATTKEATIRLQHKHESKSAMVLHLVTHNTNHPGSTITTWRAPQPSTSLQVTAHKLATNGEHGRYPARNANSIHLSFLAEVFVQTDRRRLWRSSSSVRSPSDGGGRGGTAGVKAPGRPYRSGRPPKRRMVLHAVNIVTHSRAILFFSETGVGNSRSPAFANNLIIARARPQWFTFPWAKQYSSFLRTLLVK